MEDEGEIYDGTRAQFPLTFGKQSKSQTPLEQIHNATRRPTPPSTASDDKSNAFPSLSSSSKAWLDSLRTSKTPNPNPTIGPSPPNSSPHDNEDVIIGPPRPPAGFSNAVEDDEDGKVMVGPSGDDDDDDSVMIGPPRPPPSRDSDSEEEEEEEENRHRIPMSNEIVLKGHSKVTITFRVGQYMR